MIPTMKLGSLVALTLLFVAIATPGVMRAQAESPQCTQSARAVESGRFTSGNIEALRECPVSGPSALAQAWKTGAARSESDLAALVRSSKPSLQVYNAVLEVAKNGGQPRANRLAALQAIMAMHSPRLSADPAWMLTAQVGDPIPVSADGASSSSAPPSHVTDVPDLLARLSWEDHESRVRHAAQVLRQSLEFSDPGQSPVRPGRITLTSGCRGLVTLKSTENITLRLHVIFEGSSQSDDIWLKGSVNGQPSAYSMHPPAGPIAVTYGGQQVARLTERPNAPCSRK